MEILIVVAIIGIIAAIVLPEFQTDSQQAKEAAAKESLRILKQAVEMYAQQHNGVPPGYAAVNGNGPVLESAFKLYIIRGGYLSQIPNNPFNNRSSVEMIADADNFPIAPTGAYGWIYQPKTREIKLDWPGNDTSGVPYFSY